MALMMFDLIEQIRTISWGGVFCVFKPTPNPSQEGNYYL